MKIIGETIRLRNLEKEDLGLKVKWFNDPEVNATLDCSLPLTLAKTEEWFQNAVSDDSRRDFIVETLDGEPIGTTGLIGINRIHQTAECYCVIGEKKYRGKGIGTLTHSLLIKWAFDELGLNKIWATVHTDNLAILKVIEKLGFQIEGTLREQKYIDGKYIDIIRVGLLRSEFKPYLKKKPD